MTLEPRTVTAEDDNPELRDMTRRFWISVALTVPLLAISMGSMLSPHVFMVSLWSRGLLWFELLLATPVVLWCGWPFFQRGWASVVNHSTNMFTLIAMGPESRISTAWWRFCSRRYFGVVPQHGRSPGSLF